jgi:penicillin-insensitive murein endopeptidase
VPRIVGSLFSIESHATLSALLGTSTNGKFVRVLRAALVISNLCAVSSGALASESVCYGSPGKGKLQGGVALPLKGANFSSYSQFASLLDRNYAHSRVAEIVVDAYAAAAGIQPGLAFVLGESGHAEGGRILPHRTHQNGLSVDFMVPVRDAGGKSVPLPTQPWNKYGYGVEFDSKARFGTYRIDFEAIALHLQTLHSSAMARGVRIERVIFDPAYLPLLFATKRGDYLRANISFMKHQAWVRHDDHYHVDFGLECRPYR